MALEPRSTFQAHRSWSRSWTVNPLRDKVHNLRSNTVGWRLIFEALSFDLQGSGKSMLKDLARLRKRAGKVRDMDILTVHLIRTVKAAGILVVKGGRVSFRNEVKKQGLLKTVRKTTRR